MGGRRRIRKVVNISAVLEDGPCALSFLVWHTTRSYSLISRALMVAQKEKKRKEKKNIMIMGSFCVR